MTQISDWSGVSVLVTGGAGFIGSNLVDNLVAIGAKVWVLDNLDTGELSNLSSHNLVELNQYFQKNVVVDWGKDIVFVKGSIQDTNLLEKIIPQVDFIFHLAAIASVARCEKNPDEGFSINLDSTLEQLISKQTQLKVVKYDYDNIQINQIQLDPNIFHNSNLFYVIRKGVMLLSFSEILIQSSIRQLNSNTNLYECSFFMKG